MIRAAAVLAAMLVVACDSSPAKRKEGDRVEGRKVLDAAIKEAESRDEVRSAAMIAAKDQVVPRTDLHAFVRSPTGRAGRTMRRSSCAAKVVAESSEEMQIITTGKGAKDEPDAMLNDLRHDAVRKAIESLVAAGPPVAAADPPRDAGTKSADGGRLRPPR